MSQSSRSEHLSLGFLPPPSVTQASAASTANSSPIEPPGGSLRSPFGLPSAGLSPAVKIASSSRSGAGSPSHDLSGGASRLFSKRAREIQAQEGLPLNVWGPPTSGNSTPLRENIPESPTDGFPDYMQLPTPESEPQARRARAGTVPSRFSPGGPNTGLGALPSMTTPKTSRPSPSPSPFKAPSPAPGDIGDNSAAANNAALLYRLRAGSMPQRSNFAGTSAGPFGPSVFSTNWPSGRERTSTLASIASMGSNGPSSPAQSSFSNTGTAENDMQIRTLDYLGLADTPQQPHIQMAATPFLANISDIKRDNRFRSMSLNNKDKYADEEDDYGSGSVTPYEAQQAQLQEQIAATHAAIQQHNLAVQAFANQASKNRPRARTAGVLDSPASRMLRGYFPTSSRLENSISASDLDMIQAQEYEGLPEAVQALALGQSGAASSGLLSADEGTLEGPTRALWLGSIPPSTTISTLTEMFKVHGVVKSARVLTHKNCGFVNFEHLESAVSAKQMMNGKEIFPGAGPVRINFAKPPSANGTPGADGFFPSPSPDPFVGDKDKAAVGGGVTTGNGLPGTISRHEATSPVVPDLAVMRQEIVDIVKQFGATEEERAKIAQSLHRSITYDKYGSEIPAIQESAHNRVHDAPRLRDIRKRIDNNTWTQAELEGIAMDMIPEVAELSSDYLGNTVIQKLFEFCSDDIKDAMLEEIAPHIAEIGVHKNGTWAAQKIIDVARTDHQKSMLEKYLRPHTVPLFLDQYGNYVLQCCLRFGSPHNDFIFETMLSRMWEVSQGRYGARAMRACLESHHSTKDQQRMLAAAIALHSVQLATNANGALLLTWFLDTCTFPQRRTVLAPRLVPHLVHLCTHKVAYLTVLKVINQRNEPDARDIILKAMFFTPDDQILESILKDHQCGATLIFKVLTTPFFDESIRSQVVENVRNVLVRLKAQPSQGYKRLMDEVGLSTRNASTGPNRDGREHSVNNHNSAERQRPASQQSHVGNNGHVSATPQQHQQQQQLNGQFFPQMQQQQQAAPSGFDMGVGMNMQRAESVDSNNVSPYHPFNNGLLTNNQMYAASPNVVVAPQAAAATLGMQQLQYQQSLLARAAANGQANINNGFYPTSAGMTNAGFGVFSGPSQQVIDPYGRRQQTLQNASPVQPQQPQPQQMGQNPMMGGGGGGGGQSGFSPAGFGGAGMGNMGGMGGLAGAGYGGYGVGMPAMQGMGYVQQEQVNGRRGRR